MAKQTLWVNRIMSSRNPEEFQKQCISKSHPSIAGWVVAQWCCDARFSAFIKQFVMTSSSSLDALLLLFVYYPHKCQKTVNLANKRMMKERGLMIFTVKVSRPLCQRSFPGDDQGNSSCGLSHHHHHRHHHQHSPRASWRGGNCSQWQRSP